MEFWIQPSATPRLSGATNSGGFSLQGLARKAAALAKGPDLGVATMNFPWLSTDDPWITHGLSMDYPYITHGFSMSYPQIIHGLPMDYP